VADWTIKAGDTGPIYEDRITLEDGTVPNLTGATIAFTMRSYAAAAALTLTGTATITDTATGDVQFAPSLADTTGRAGQYMALWRVTLADASTMSFPTRGYLSVTIEENLITAGQQLVSLPEAKEYLGINSGDRAHDARLARYIRAALPTVENICGPIIPKVYDEWHRGGGPTIQIRRRPSSTYGTTPVLGFEGVVDVDGDDVTLGVSEYIGSTLHPLTVVASPSLGSTYSCMTDALGTITRRSGGGGVTVFAHDVHVVYQAGQSSIPANVTEGTLELLRANWHTTRPTGVGRMSPADDLDTATPLHFYVPRKVAEMLAPSRRAPSIA